MLTGAGTGTLPEGPETGGTEIAGAGTGGTETGGTETEGTVTGGTVTEGTETEGTVTCGRATPGAELGTGTGSPEPTDETLMAEAVEAAATTAPVLSATTLATSVALDATRS